MLPGLRSLRIWICRSAPAALPPVGLPPSRSIDLRCCPLQGYLAAVSASAYSLVSMVQRFGPHMNPGGAVISLTYNASNQTIPGYGGGMSSAKAVSRVV